MNRPHTHAPEHEALASTDPVAVIAAHYGVSKSAIYRLKSGNTWSKR